ncbi:hypothetical protein AG1IA_09975 [Rhizoctonia solani AG-1 IA]|uniref:Uncharacterized protein n=1 Tax=Thanatephorus cucumeris (strain AG1-IA) TaxID=983506 RepID=L8WCU3_THACA|nr:hypothetical protein AG1IA_09975 [Rhizoctonia solani AG-1 IA]
MVGIRSNDSRRTLVSHDQFTYTSLWTTQLKLQGYRNSSYNKYPG